MFGFGRRAYLDYDSEKRIVNAIGDAEKNTRAEIRVHLAAKIKKDIYQDAVSNFKRLGLYKTELRSAVMIYVVPGKKEFAIVGDVGIHEKVRDEFWQSVRDAMAAEFKTSDMAAGIIKGIELAGHKLEEYFPLNHGPNPNEISNRISRG
jgi:uncharacterized membrane protein